MAEARTAEVCRIMPRPRLPGHSQFRARTPLLDRRKPCARSKLYGHRNPCARNKRHGHSSSHGHSKLYARRKLSTLSRDRVVSLRPHLAMRHL
jgi:hypothetical protein